MSAFLLALRVVVCNTLLVLSSPKLIFSSSNISKVQGSRHKSTSSGMAALAPFLNSFTYVSFSHFTHLVVNNFEFHKQPMPSCAFAYYVGPCGLLSFP